MHRVSTWLCATSLGLCTAPALAMPASGESASAVPLADAQPELALASQLHAAAQAGDLPRVQRLLAAGAAVDAQDAHGNSALLLATAANREAVAQALIAAGAQVNLKNQRQDSAYLLAGAMGHEAILRMTLAAGADLRSVNRYGGTALIPACERGHVGTVRTLIAAGVDVNHVNALGWTCLLEVVILGQGGAPHQAIVRALIAEKADLNLPDRDGVSSLAHARAKGQTEIVRLLQAAGAR